MASNDIGFNDTTIINGDDPATLLAMLDKLTRIAEGRRILPYDQMANVTYAHRASFSEYGLQIGDACFMVPPEFICVTSESTSQQIVTLRQENSMRQKAGSHKRTLLIDLVFNGSNQINGYRVEGPESAHGKDYYIDGLRQMLAQFKCTPFLPIQNEFINGTHGIFTVVLQSITISTVPGFPGLMTAHLTLQEVEMFPYLEMPNAAFRSMIDWDLFRYYYQRFLTETHEYKKLQSIPVDKRENHFKISVLKESVFSDMTSENNTELKYGDKNATLLREICDNDNYDVWVDSSTQNVKINGFQCGYYNILTNMQLNDNACPTVQFMGGMDTIFNISLETTDVSVITALEQCRMYNDAMIRSNPKYCSLGFVKLESELVEFTGSLFVVIDNVITSTVPEFPGLYQAQIQCVSFDIGQSARESLNGFLPFDDDIAKQIYGKNYKGSCARLNTEETDDVDVGYVSDHVHEEQIIEQSMDGLLVKVRQDCYAEWKMRTTLELYPDLYLPTYAEVDDFILKCNAFRVSKGLPILPYSKYPTRPECMVQGIPITNNVQLTGDVILAKDIPSHNEYAGFVDPDFYVFYPNSYLSFSLDCYDYEGVTRTALSKDITINTKPFGNDPNSELSSSYAGIPNGTLIDDFVDVARQQIGKRYSQEIMPPEAFACSTLVWWGLLQVGVLPPGDNVYNSPCLRVTRMLADADSGTGLFRRVPASEMRRGDLIILYNNPPNQKTPNYKDPANGSHVMIYEGGDMVVHAKGVAYGVVENAYASINNPEKYDVLRIVAFETATGASLNDVSSLEERQAVLWSTLKSLGYTDVATAGIIANWTDESECQTRKIEYDRNGQFQSYGGYDIVYDPAKMTAWTQYVWTAYDEYPETKWFLADNGAYYCGIGLAQWTGPRALALLTFAGDKWDDFDTQMAFAIQELDTGYAETKAAIQAATDPAVAAELFCRGFEGLNVEADVAQRKQLATTIYEKFTGPNAPSAGSFPSSSGNNKNTLTRAEVDGICKVIYGQAEGIRDYQKEVLGLAQMVYDLLTTNQTSQGLGTILNSKFFFPEFPAESYPDDVVSIVESVFCENVKRWPDSTVVAYTSPTGTASFDTFEKMYTQIIDEGQLTFWEKKPRKVSSNRKFTIIESDTTGAASMANYDITTNIYYPVKQAELDKFAEPVFVKTDAILYTDHTFDCWFKDEATNVSKRKQSREVLNDGENIFGSSFVDEAQYSCRGRLVRAFPTYAFCILDDDAQWYMGNKLWTNYYMRKSVVDIQVHETNDMPIATAVLTVSNVYGNLSQKQRGLSNYDIKNDMNLFQRAWYGMTGQVIDLGSPNLTDSTIKLKQVIYQNAKVREGSRAHIRIGYGSDPLSLATVMNGTISEVAVGSQLTIVVTSDGVELTQHITSATEKTNNGWLGLFGLGEDQESSNLIANILCKRDSVVNYFVSEWFEGSKYGIEHFGLFFNQTAMTIVGGLATGAIAFAGAAIGMAAGPVGAIIGAGIGALVGMYFTSDVTVKDLWDGYAEQYDICKNLYKANYLREHYIYASVAEADGESNICFNEVNMTPWDVMQIATQQVPEYIVKPSYHQFDSRLYFGLPLWMEKYRYDYLGGLVYEECKASAQVHIIESLTNIIDNQVKVTKKYNDTNKKVLYVCGDSPASTKVIHSDDTIFSSNQKTGIIDSAVTQDFLGPDALYEFLGMDVGQEAARRIGISNLLYEWQLQYQGEIICMGLPGVKAHDYILLNDFFTSMMGVAVVREVTHSFSTDTGFTTSITPGMIGFSSDQQSGLIVAMQNYLQVLHGFSNFLTARHTLKVNYEKNLQMASAMAVLAQKEKVLMESNGWYIAGTGVRHVSTAINAGATAYGTVKVGAELIKFCAACIKNKKIAEFGPIFANTVAAFKEEWGKADDAASAIKVVKALKKVDKLTDAVTAGAKAAFKTIFRVNPYLLLASIAIELILNELFEWLENRNVCVLLPLWFEGYPFVSGIQGGQKILLMGSSSSLLFGRESGVSENQNESADEELWNDD